MSNENTLNVPLSFIDGVMHFVDLSSQTTKKALDEIGVRRMAEKRAKDIQPGLLQHMLDNKVVEPREKTAAEAMLSSHDTTLQLLKAAVDRIAELSKMVKSAELGSGVDDTRGVSHEHVGGYDSLNSPFVGQKTDNIKASDLALARGAGVQIGNR